MVYFHFLNLRDQICKLLRKFTKGLKAPLKLRAFSVSLLKSPLELHASTIDNNHHHRTQPDVRGYRQRPSASPWGLEQISYVIFGPNVVNPISVLKLRGQVTWLRGKLNFGMIKRRHREEEWEIKFCMLISIDEFIVFHANICKFKDLSCKGW